MLKPSASGAWNTALAVALVATPVLLAASPAGTPVWRLWQSIAWVGAVTVVAGHDRPIRVGRFGPRALAAGLLGALALFPITAVAHALTGILTGRSTMPGPGETGDDQLPLLVAGMLTAAVLEELAFRGLLQSGLEERLDAPPALAATAVLFALYHGAPLQWPSALLLGLGFGWLSLQYGLGAAVTAHVSYNAVGALLYLSLTL